jgi:L-amino acid N-acyltransferase YncA
VDAAVIVRPATPDDAKAVAAVYAPHVLTGTGTFEEVPPSAQEMAGRMAAVLERGLPWVLACDEDGAPLGFAYAAPYRLRAAYRYTAEDSVYVAPQAMGRGVGRAVLEPVIAACRARGLRQLVAVIGDSGNAGSIGLHRALGFQPAGVLAALGYKHGRWIDVALMQLALNGGAAGAPAGPGLGL